MLAVKQIFASPEEYGFYVTEKDLYKPILSHDIEITEPIEDLADFAIEHGITYRELKEMNPWLREINLKNSANKTYIIKIPEPNAFLIEDEI
jgi:hypothetical protein